MNGPFEALGFQREKTYSLASPSSPGYVASTGSFIRSAPPLLPVKITLNTSSIPENRRPQVEAVVKSFAKTTEIIWLPSRFPRFVMLVEPGADNQAQPEGGSIFESPTAGSRSLASVTEFLEGKIKECLAEPA
jgi:hypothetical protein